MVPQGVLGPKVPNHREIPCKVALTKIHPRPPGCTSQRLDASPPAVALALTDRPLPMPGLRMETGTLFPVAGPLKGFH